MGILIFPKMSDGRFVLCTYMVLLIIIHLFILEIGSSLKTAPVAVVPINPIFCRYRWNKTQFWRHLRLIYHDTQHDFWSACVQLMRKGYVKFGVAICFRFEDISGFRFRVREGRFVLLMRRRLSQNQFFWTITHY